MTICFKPLTSLKPGHLFDMLVNSYSDLIEKYDWKNKDKYLESWRKMDSSLGFVEIEQHFNDT